MVFRSKVSHPPKEPEQPASKPVLPDERKAEVSRKMQHSFISADTKVTGDSESAGEISVEGSVEGNIRALSRTSLLVFLVAFHLSTILMLAPTRPALADLEDGRVAFKRGDFSAALNEWEPLAEAGDPYAQGYLGLLYYDGIGLSQNLLEAEKWFRMAADQGHALAQIRLGVMYGEGQGVRADLVQAFMWFTLAESQMPFGEIRERVHKDLNIVAAVMTPEQIIEASRLADEWHPKIQGSIMLKAREKGSQQEKSAQTTAPKTGPRDVAAKTTVAIQPEPASSGFFVQSASLKTMDLAHEERSRQQHAYPDLLGDLRLAIREADLSSQGKVFRLQIGPLQNRSIAEDLCQQLKAKEQGCFVLKRIAKAVGELLSKERPDGATVQ